MPDFGGEIEIDDDGYPKDPGQQYWSTRRRWRLISLAYLTVVLVALCVTAGALLGDVGALGRMPVVICGVFAVSIGQVLGDNPAPRGWLAVAAALAVGVAAGASIAWTAGSPLLDGLLAAAAVGVAFVVAATLSTPLVRIGFHAALVRSR